MKPFVPLAMISLLARKLSLRERHIGQVRVVGEKEENCTWRAAPWGRQAELEQR